MSDIPRQIHYCWFGENEMSPIIKKCIASWSEILPEYELIKWSEDNFDVYSHEYTKEAYRANKMAFVSDYVRLKALYEHGGIYLDTDVEVIESFNPFLDNPAFCGFESDYDLGSSVIGAKPGNNWINAQLNNYSGRSFIKRNGDVDHTTISTNFGKISKDTFGLVMNNSLQDLGGIIVYPKDYFCAKESFTGEIKTTENTVCIHHFLGSWHDNRMIIKHITFRAMRKALGNNFAEQAYRLYKSISNKNRY